MTRACKTRPWRSCTPSLLSYSAGCEAFCCLVTVLAAFSELASLHFAHGSSDVAIAFPGTSTATLTFFTSIWDHDLVSNDIIGSVFIDLNSLLYSESNPTIAGWFPIFDTLRGALLYDCGCSSGV